VSRKAFHEPPARRVRRWGTLALALVGLALPGLGCNAFQGALLYRDGTRALDAGDPATAIAALEEAAVRAPQASEVQNHLGLAYLAAERRGDALRAFERAVALDCDNRAAQRNLRALRAAAEQP
jgi:tetratricopeptide (TPR) repeat protein